MVGVWNGKLGLMDGSNLIEATKLTVTDQEERRFFGEMMIGEICFMQPVQLRALEQ